jgi:LysR family hydrogen peroxide-inducible transcriptional activator
MVASGTCVKVVPRRSVPKDPQPHIQCLPFSDPMSTRCVVLDWHRTFARYAAIAALRNCVEAMGCRAWGSSAWEVKPVSGR